ncbi:MAG: PRC-barrel domain containing protein [Sphingomonas sp.]
MRGKTPRKGRSTWTFTRGHKREGGSVGDAAGWVALVATSVAALMTASNLGARVTGWGFAIFTLGAAAWITVGIFTHQTQLLYSNIFLALVDLFGVWRWLGRRARISDTAQAEENRSDQQVGEALFSTAKLDRLPVIARGGAVVATTVDALAARSSGRIDHLIIRAGGVGGVGEKLYRLPWSATRIDDDAVQTDLADDDLARLSLASGT